MIRVVCFAWTLALGAACNPAPGEPLPPAGEAAASTCSAAPSSGSCAAPDDVAALGLQDVSLRTTAGGRMLDLRFRVADPRAAERILGRGARVALRDGSHGVTLPVPGTPTVGSLRQVAVRPEAGRSYFVLFANPGGRVGPGDAVALDLDGRIVADLTVAGAP